MSVPNSGDSAALSLPTTANPAPTDSRYLDPVKRLAERLHAAALRRAHLAAEHTRALIAAPDGTTGKHELSDLTIAGENRAAGVHFLSTPWAALRWMHDAVLPASDKSAWTFVDLGAGKGRAVLSAAAQNYGRIIGVEFAAELAAQARTNIDAEGHDPDRVKMIEGDASAFELPDAPCVVFLFNPFGPPVLDRVIERLVARGTASARPIRIAYLNPVHAQLFDSNPAFRRIALTRRRRFNFGMLSPYRLALYETINRDQA